MAVWLSEQTGAGFAAAGYEHAGETVPETQIFISYARDDDIPPPQGGKGFVSYLHEQLAYVFKDSGPFRPKIWRDITGIDPGDQFDPRIADAIAASAILLVVLSRNWMARPYCQRELKAFGERWSSEDELQIRRRVIFVGKRHVDRDRRPSLLQGQEGYLFYTLDAAGAEGLEHQFFSQGKVQDDRYYQLLDDLAGFLLRTATRLSPREQTPEADRVIVNSAPAPALNGRTIYVAKPADDMRPAYDRVVKELGGHGYAILPEPGAELPHDRSAAGTIDAWLARAEASIHLLGEEPGYAVDNAQRIVGLQLAHAAARVSPGDGGGDGLGFRRIIWAPKVLERRRDDVAEVLGDRNPIEVLCKFGNQMPNDKIDGDVLSKFVDFLIQHLIRMAPPVSRPPQIKADFRIYLCHSEEEDTDFVFKVAEELLARDVEAVFPAFEGDEVAIKTFHRTNLAECDAVALCWAGASEVWVRARSNELRDWHGLGRGRPFAYRAVVAGPPLGPRKKNIRRLFPSSEIDLTVDLTDKDRIAPGLIDRLVPAAPADAHGSVA